MNKTFKGAGAAVAAGVLLLGGAGSLASWSDSEPVTGTDITSGTLSLDNGGVDHITDNFEADGTTVKWDNCSTWQFDGETLADGHLLVPGDEVTKTCDYTVNATGDNLAATLTLGDTEYTTESGLEDNLPATVVYTLGDSDPLVPGDQLIDDSNNNDALNAVITVKFDSDLTTGLDAQGLTATLDAVTIGLTQNG